MGYISIKKKKGRIRKRIKRKPRRTIIAQAEVYFVGVGDKNAKRKKGLPVPQGGARIKVQDSYFVKERACLGKSTGGNLRWGNGKTADGKGPGGANPLGEEGQRKDRPFQTSSGSNIQKDVHGWTSAREFSFPCGESHKWGKGFSRGD